MILSKFTLVEHDSTDGDPSHGSWRKETTRVVFDPGDGRVLGTETCRHHWNEGNFGRGWTWREDAPVTAAFASRAEGVAWVDELHIQQHLGHASRS